MHEYSCSNLRAGPGRSRKLNLNMNMIFTLCKWGWLRLAPRLVIASNWIRLDQTGSKSRLNQVHKDQRVKILVLGGSLEYHFWNKIPLFLRFCSVCDSVEPFFVKREFLANEMAWNTRWVIERNLNASDNNILMQLFLDIQDHNIISPCHRPSSPKTIPCPSPFCRKLTIFRVQPFRVYRPWVNNIRRITLTI